MPLSWNEIRSRAVDARYRKSACTSDAQRVEFLFERYQHLTCLLPAETAKSKRIRIAVQRVAARVAQGGHNIPETTIRRRFASGITNFARYKLLVNHWELYDNSAAPAVLLDEGEKP